MKRYYKSYILLLAFVLILSNLTTVHGQSNNYEDKFQTILRNFFSSQLESIKTGSEKPFIKEKNNIDLKSSSGKQLYDYELGRLKYTITSYSLSTDKIYDYKLDISFDRIILTENKANIYTTVSYNIFDSWANEDKPIVTEHEVSLNYHNGNWLISDDKYSDELKDLYPFGTDFDKLIIRLKESINKSNNTLLNTNISEFTTSSIEPPISYIVPGDYYASYNRTKAVEYALKWTSEGTGSSGSSYNSSQFKYFSYGYDCQNYVSQCIWSGFGGTSISPISYPMNSIDWWANTTSTSKTTDNKWNWTSTADFLYYITNNYSKNNYYGIQGYTTTNPNIIQIGDYVYVPGHVMFVTKITDLNQDGITSFNEIYISAHTNNHLNYNLSQLYKGSQPVDMQYVKVLRIRCNDGTSL